MRCKKLFIGLTGILACCLSYSYASQTTIVNNGVTTTTQNLSVDTTIINTGPGNPQIGINLGSPAQVQILRGTTLLTAATLPAGVSYIGTNNFPAGSYAVNILVTEGRLTFNVVQNITIAAPATPANS